MLQRALTPMYVFSVYIKPSMNADHKREMVDLLTDAIVEIKTREGRPNFFIMGDFNKMPIVTIANTCPSIELLLSPPTRNDACLDLILTNVKRNALITDVARPLQTETGIPSDHDVLYATFKFECNHEFQ